LVKKDTRPFRGPQHRILQGHTSLKLQVVGSCKITCRTPKKRLVLPRPGEE
jgi:hypothetical protein